MDELRGLAGHFRRRIRETVGRNGGHLASNLGLVELTMAIHRNFDLNRDRLLFDTSHQCYVHKLLTGRDGERFDRLRRAGGLSGFANPAEHRSDLLTIGHAATALSVASGLSIADGQSGREGEILVLLGDASLSCGLTMEALNNLGRCRRRLILILNDNGRSIGPGTGQIHHMLHPVADLEDVAKFFRLYGLDYLGPVDGHDFAALDGAFQSARQAPRSLVIHVRTVKGWGYAAAVRDPERFHGVAPSEETACPSQSAAKFLSKLLPCLMDRNPSLVAVTAAMDLGTGLASVRERFPERHFDVGIAEGHAVTFAAGLALGGLRPICAIYSTFIQRAVDNVFHDVCLQNLPVIFLLDHAGPSAADGDTHHGLYDIAQLACLPNLILAQPSSLADLSSLIGTALVTPAPFAIRYSKHLPGCAPDPSLGPPNLQPGRSRRRRVGSDVSIWALGGRRLEQAERLADRFAVHGISTEVIDPIFIRPLDLDRLRKSAVRVRLLVTLEDHVLEGGFGSILATALGRLGLTQPLEIFAWRVPVGFAENEAILERAQGLDDDSIADQILSRLSDLTSAVQ